jgi:hypothetical protein
VGHPPELDYPAVPEPVDVHVQVLVAATDFVSCRPQGVQDYAVVVVGEDGVTARDGTRRVICLGLRPLNAAASR